jgi:hypothetical protein
LVVSYAHQINADTGEARIKRMDKTAKGNVQTQAERDNGSQQSRSRMKKSSSKLQ